MSVPREPKERPALVVYTIRVEQKDIDQARRLKINLGAVLRRYIKAVVWKQSTIAEIKKEQEKWKVKPKA